MKISILWAVFLLGVPIWAAELAIRPSLTLEPIPEEYDLYLQRPVGVEFDESGRFYILDLESRAVFVWAKDGRFLTHFGKQGEGPGEFSFVSRNGNQGFISVLKDGIYVYDGAKRILHDFDMNHQFIRSRALPGLGGKTVYFSMTEDHKILLWQKDVKRKKPVQKLALYDEETFKLEKTFYEAEENLYDYKRKNGKVNRIVINAYAPGITMFCDTSRDKILVGNTDQTAFRVYNSSGEMRDTIRFKPLDNKVTDEDIAEFKTLPFLKERPDFYQLKFPDEKPFYEVILPIKDDHYLLYSTSPVQRTLTGIMINHEGERLGRFTYSCGESGGFWGAGNRVIAIQTDEEGRFIIQELDFVTPTNPG